MCHGGRGLNQLFYEWVCVHRATRKIIVFCWHLFWPDLAIHLPQIIQRKKHAGSNTSLEIFCVHKFFLESKLYPHAMFKIWILRPLMRASLTKYTPHCSSGLVSLLAKFKHGLAASSASPVYVCVVKGPILVYSICPLCFHAKPSRRKNSCRRGVSKRHPSSTSSRRRVRKSRNVILSK